MHFQGEHGVQVEVVAYTYHTDTSCASLSPSGLYRHTRRRSPICPKAASENQIKGWKEKAVRNAPFITRGGCLRLGLEVYDGDNPYSGN